MASSRNWRSDSSSLSRNPLLVERHLLQGRLQFVRVHFGKLIAQLVELLPILGRRALQQLLQVLEPLIQLRVGQTGVLQGFAQLRQLALQRVDRLHHFVLALKRLGNLFALREIGLAFPAAPGRFGFALVPLLEFAGFLLGQPRLLGQLLHAFGRPLQFLLRGALQLRNTPHPEAVFGALARLTRRMIVDHPGPVPDRVAGRQRPARDVQHRTHDGPHRTTELDRMHHGLVRLAERADSLHDDLQPFDAMVVPGVHHQRLAQVHRHDRVIAGKDDGDLGGPVGDHLQHQRLGSRRRFPARGIREVPGIGARALREPTGFEAGAADIERHHRTLLVVHERPGANDPAALAPHPQVRARGNRERRHFVAVFAGRQGGVRRIRDLEREAAHEEGVDGGEDMHGGARAVRGFDPVADLGVDGRKGGGAGPLGEARSRGTASPALSRPSAG